MSSIKLSPNPRSASQSSFVQSSTRRLRRFALRIASLSVCLAAGIVVAQVPGPVNLKGSGGNTVNQVVVPAIGTGGTISTQGAYTVHVFNSSANFVPPVGLSTVDVLVVGGGGGGGGTYGGGGGAGGLRTVTGFAIGAGTIAVTVGGGGAGGDGVTSTNDEDGDGTNGGNSQFDSIIAIGGGYGQGGAQNDNNQPGGSGGSGGGGGGITTGGSNVGGNGTAGQGSNGGTGNSNSDANNRSGGGGGGAGSAGAIGTNGSGGSGGAGQNFSAQIGTSLGVSGWFAGGGGGGKRSNGGTGGAGGQGGGGAGGGPGAAGSPGVSNTGGGGGASSNGIAGAAGGSGVVIVRYIAPSTTYVVHRFTSSGTFTPPSGVSNVEVLVVGGGGGGGAALGFSTAGAGGGGAGGLVHRGSFAVAGAVAVGVGNGGTAATSGNTSGNNGVNSTFGTLVALGGGGGIGGNGSGNSGGSGGGSRGASGGVATQPGSGSGGFGFRGGDSGGAPGGAAGTGGGGAGAAGQNLAGAGTEAGGTGGVGLAYNITGTSLFYAGGGGGGASQNSGAVGAGGTGGGGAGGRDNTAPTVGTANTGGGGGGGNNSRAGANGGSGVVIVRYVAPTVTITTQPSSSAVSGAAFAQPAIVRLLDGAGNPVVGASITASIGSGAGTLGGTLTRVTAADGRATFTDLQITGAVGDRRIRFTPAGTADYVESNTVAIISYHLEISHIATMGVCASSTPVTISVVDSNSNPVPNFAGVVTITNSLGLGNYTLNTGTPARFDNLASNDGIAEYEFAVADAGSVTLNFTAPSIGTYTFNATSGSTGTENYAGGLVVSACSFRISHDTAGNVCTADAITIGVYANGALVTTYAGNVNLSTAGLTGGNWLKSSTASDALGTLNNGAANDGAATYSFLAGDGGEIALNFQDNTAETVNFNVTASGVSAPGGIYDANFVVSKCTFRVTHSEEMDVCTPEAVTITLVDSAGSPVTGYTGTINLSTSTGRGTWAKTSTPADAEGTITDPISGDGGATYQFVTSDLGTITLRFTHPGADGVVNINITDGATTDPQNSANTYDKSIAVGLCKIEISHSQSSTACEIEAVTFTIRNSEGGLAEDYEGTLAIGTSTLHGNWLVNTGAGVLTESAGDDNGIASYAFGAADDGVVILDFSNPHAELVNFDATDNAIIVDAINDPDLTVSSCLPAVTATVCNVGNNSASIGIPAQSAIASQRGRMVLLLVSRRFPQSAGGVPTFNSAAMTLISQTSSTSGGDESITEMWGIREADLPVSAGTYSGVIPNGPEESAMCLLTVADVEQTFPVAASPAATGPLNTSTGFDPLTTDITTQANNSLVVTASSYEASYFYPADTASPGYLSRIFGQSGPIANPRPFGESDPNNSESRFIGAAGRLPAAGITSILDELEFGNGFLGTQIVASFKPLIAGAPLASDYVPVLLEQTYSGNMSYRAIGATLRSTYNEDSPTPLACNFVNFATGAAATLTLPVGATITAAHLYWGGSGSDDLGQTDIEVDFGITGSEVSITADDTYLVDNTGSNNVDYFSGYKDVTAIVSGNGNYTLKNLTVQNGSPWNASQACAGGWGLVVIYEHTDERLRVVNLFQGFQPFQDSSFTLVPRNFRMATNNPAQNLPNGQVTHITMEGDETLNSPDSKEGLGIQTAPGLTTFTNITSSLNPLGQEFNSTVTRPVYSYNATTEYFEFNATGGVNGDGYEIDNAGPQATSGGPRFGNTWGVDVDTHYIQGGNSGTLLHDFAVLDAEAEKITTRYSAEQDLVLLMSEVISITNYPVADIEVVVSETSTFKVDSTGTYQIDVKNNGDGGFAGGFANGEILVAGILPTGMTFSSAGDVAGTGWSCSVTLDPGAYSCVYDIATTWTGGADAGELASGESLPPITLTVEVGDSGTFPLRNNNAKNSVRVLHSGGSCPATANGVIPDADDCARSPQFDNVNDLEGGNLNINNLDDKQANNNNIDSVTTVVKGVEIDLAINKFVEDILESGETGVYTLRVTNNGPDATTATITVNDVEPTGVTFTAAAGTGWVCAAFPGDLSCTYAGSLASGATTDILVTVDVTGPDGDFVTNVASVTPGAFNFDIDDSNDSDTDVTQIVGPPVASQERFLMSVSSLGEETSIGGLTGIEDDDYFIYDPATDTAEMFLDNSALGFNINDADAVHILKNGHIVISAKSSSSIGTGGNLLNFEPGDLVVYDPILGTTSLLFDGSAVFGGTDADDNNITAVYVNEDGTIDIAVTAANAGSTIGSNGLTINNNSIYRYTPGAGGAVGTASEILDVSAYLASGGSDDLAIATGYYKRVDPSNPNATLDSHIFTFEDTADDSVNTSTGGSNAPTGGTYASQDDVTEIDIDADSTENLFLGNVEQGVFDSTGAASDLLIDALHLVEDGYIGHFRISEVGGNPSVCSATGLYLRVSKHEGLTHTRDTDYAGSIRLTTNTGEGNWVLISGNGTLNNGSNGAAIYTYVASDAGTVILSLSQSTGGPVNVDVTNGIAREGHPPGVGSEAPVFTYTEGVTLNYLDNFSTVSYANQDGTNAWGANWVESDDAAGGTGASAGNVRVTGGKAVLRRANGTSNSSLTRSIDLSGATLDSNLLLSFSYSFTNLGLSDEFVVEARDGVGSWVELRSFKRGTTLANVANGNGLSGNLSFGMPTGPNVEIRFRIKTGYTSGGTFSIDNVKLTAETSDCNVSPLGVNHYEINIKGVKSGTASGVACVGADITITAHDAAHSAVIPGAISIYLTSNTGRGNWSRILTGTGTLANGTVNDGAATYTFPNNEESVQLHFDYTGPVSDPEVVNINVTDNANVEFEDPNYSVSKVGLRVFNSGTGDAVTPIPLQIAGKPSNVNPNASLLFVQVVNSSDTNPGVCEPLFSVGETLDLGFSAVCEDSGTCITATETFGVNGTDVALIDAGDTINYTELAVTLTDIGGGVPGAPILINYSDVGKMRLHTSFDFPLGDNTDPLLATKSGDTVTARSNQFIVRPFGFDIDFTDGRENNDMADASYAADHNGTIWKVAGQSFDTTVTSVAWESGDDTNNDGVPDAGADLSDNHATPNFDVDSAAGNYSVKLSVIETKVAGGIDGVLTNDDFDNFSLGVNTHSIVYNEVGIIDMRADIVNASDVVIPYLGKENVEGRVLNVGRFIPNLFSVTKSDLTGRADMSCTPASSFTYMDEPFQVELELVAKGLTDSGNYTTVNYRGPYAKLDILSELALVAIDDIAGSDDVDYTTRLGNVSLPSSSFAATWNNGILSLTGNMEFQRALTGIPDGPFPGMQIAFKPTDNDGVTIDPARIDIATSLGLLNVDLDVMPTEPGTDVYYLIDEHEFRYGRLIVNNAYGPETENLALTFQVEYFNGSEFVRNTLDNCSVIDVDDLSFVSGTYTDDLEPGNTVLTTPDTVTFLEGQTQGFENVATPSDSPLETSAPGEDASGGVDITLDLNAAGLSYLGFEWDDADGDYNEDPTGRIEFGQFRMHDRIINWQEIYNSSTP